MRTPTSVTLVAILCAACLAPTLAATTKQPPLPLKVSLLACTDTIYTRQPVRLLVQLEVIERFQGCIFNLNEWSTRAIVHVNPSKDVHAPAFRSLLTGPAIDDLPAAAEMRVYEPGYTQNADILVGYHYYDKKRFFAEPGEYEITVALNILAGHDRRTATLHDVLSNPAHVTVREPRGAEGAAAILWMNTPLHNGLVPHRKQALQLIEQYPDTTYADYARFLLTRHSDYRWADWSIPVRERLPADQQRALLKQVVNAERIPQVSDLAWSRLTELGLGAPRAGAGRADAHEAPCRSGRHAWSWMQRLTRP